MLYITFGVQMKTYRLNCQALVDLILKTCSNTLFIIIVRIASFQIKQQGNISVIHVEVVLVPCLCKAA